MFGISEASVKRLKEEYPVGCRVELIHMEEETEPEFTDGEIIEEDASE